MSQIITSTKQLGQSVKRYRNLKSLKQQDIAKNTDLGQKSISFLEQGKPGVRLETLFKVLSELDLEIVIQQKLMSQNTGKGEGFQDEW
jgi:HTH-type transcriptional regulator / antitoxin HipB